MRALGLLVRAGAVVLALAAVFATLDGGPPEPAAQAAPRVDRPAPRAPAARRQAPLGTVSIAATGDIVMGSTPRLPPATGAHFFDAVEPALAGQVVLGNLEGTLSSGGPASAARRARIATHSRPRPRTPGG